MQSNARDILAKLVALKVNFKIGLLQGGEWTAPDNLQGNAFFKGYVVFLLNAANK